MKEEKNKKTWALVVLGGLIVLVLAGVLFLVWYIDRIGGELVALEEEVMIQTIREQQADAVGNFLEDIANEENTVASFFVHKDNVLHAIQTLESLGTAIGEPVSLAQVEVIDQTPQTPGVLSVRLSSAGSWSAMMRLLSLLEHLPFHAEISQAALGTGSGTSAEPARWSLQVLITAALVE